METFARSFVVFFFLPQSLSLLLHDSYAAAMHAMKPLLLRTAYDSSDIDEEDLSEWVPTERRGPKHEMKKYKQMQKSRDMSSGRAKMNCRCLYLL